MKKFIIPVALLLSLSLNVLLACLAIRNSKTEETEQIPDTEITQDWDTFILALAWVESRWDTKAVGPTNDLGYLQITPIMVKDANRIAGCEKYTLEDRLDKDKSIEMFNLIQDTYNPEHDLQFALKIQNPYSKVSYHRAVMKKYNELQQNI